ncbi:MAG TPA: phosphoglycerate dehydrogenase [Candidatus Merdibacter merdavium]|uniref:D-3-phosphoglycerate dehydrogenase n=1 Tax=Candidatus Merdibacter merdavium TaxID=2838692 RepID=A0A9D2SVD1_9FIRM|nr:phosphoglycerate dehydrogenase [Candidatus Merdibacter merdavium]
MKVRLMNKISQEGLKRLPADRYEVGEDMEHADAIMVRSASLHEMTFEPELKCIARAGAGVNNIPLERCSEQGIVVFNTPGGNSNAVKELTIAGLLLASRKIVKGIEWVKTLEPEDIAKAVEKGKSQFAGPEIAGKKLGVIGLGAIGVQVANAAAALGMDVYGYDPYISVRAAWTLKARIHHISELKTIFEECDYITLHLPLMDSTRGMLNAEAFAQMKDHVRIVNFARDALVNEDALAAAITQGIVAAYVTDFASPKLVGLDQVIITPHLGASTPESEDNCARMAANEIRDYLEWGNIRNSVNMPEVVLSPSAHNRICIINRNVPNMVAKIASKLGECGINIENMANKARGNHAYTIVETNDTIDAAAIEEIRRSEGIIRVRVIHFA